MAVPFFFKNHKIAFLFAFVSLSVTVFRASTFSALFDLSYVLEHSFRMSLGDTIYKDFFIPYPPGTFLIQEFLISVFGKTYYPQIIYCGVVSFLTYILLYRLLFFLTDDKLLNIFLALPAAITGGYGLFSQPFYDPDTILLILLSLYAVLYAHSKKFPGGFTFLAGVLVVVPALFKQNTGLVYLALVHASFIGAALFRKDKEASLKSYLWFFLGSAAAAILTLFVISVTSGLGNYFFSTFVVPSRIRLPQPMEFIKNHLNFVILRYTAVWLLLAVMLWFVKTRNLWFEISAFFFLLLPFYLIPLFRAVFLGRSYYDQFYTIWPSAVIVFAVAEVYGMLKQKNLPVFKVLLNMTMILVVIAAFLSQGYRGSTYALWPLLSLLFAFLYFILSNSGLRKDLVLIRKLFIVNSAAIAVSMLFFVWFKVQLSSSFDTQGELHSSAWLKGLTLPGEYVPNMDNLLTYVRTEIPSEDALIVIPHEDPFYFASGRKPLFPYFLDSWTLWLYSTEDLINKMKSYDVRWMIFKTERQGQGAPPPNLPNPSDELKKEFTLYKILPGYEIYRIATN
jgi:hypothetical protein